MFVMFEENETRVVYDLVKCIRMESKNGKLNIYKIIGENILLDKDVNNAYFRPEVDLFHIIGWLKGMDHKFLEDTKVREAYLIANSKDNSAIMI